jgi:IS5 family transposase
MKSKPFSSPLWPHLAVILKMRRRRRTWKEIAYYLAQKGVSVNSKTIANFHRRAKARGRHKLTAAHWPAPPPAVGETSTHPNPSNRLGA